MYRGRLKWIGWLLLMSALPSIATSAEEDIGPMPPPKGPFFSSKPLLYFGEELSLGEVGSQNGPETDQLPPGYTEGYPIENGLNFYEPAPYGYGVNRAPFRQPPISPIYPGAWGTPPAYNPYNQNYMGYPPFYGNGGRR